MYDVLIVDDEPIFRRNLKKKVEWSFLGLNICGESGNGQEALEMINALKPNIILCDIRMPILGGLDVLESVTSTPNMKFIMISGAGDFEFTRKAIVFGAFDYLLKPVRGDELAGVLMRAVESLNENRSSIALENRFKIDVVLKAFDRYSSYFIHFTEEKDIQSIYNYVDMYYSEFDVESDPGMYSSSYKEFKALFIKIGEMFKIEESILLEWERDSLIKNDQPFMVPARVKMIFGSIVKYLITTQHTGGKDIVRKVMMYIDSNYSEQMSLETISSQFYINPTYFSQLFKKTIGENFSTYLIMKRIEKAKMLLATMSFKIYQVSKMVGYNDDKHFGKIFKKYTGQSPSEYAHSCSNDDDSKRIAEL